MYLLDRTWPLPTATLAVFLFFGVLGLPAASPIQEAKAEQPKISSSSAPRTGLPSQRPGGQSLTEVTATAYCDYGITKSGAVATKGVVAADPSVFPMGSVLEVRAGRYSGIYTVLDTGSAVKGATIDIFIPDYEEAVQFGRRKVRVRVLRRGWSPKVAQMAVAG